MNCDFITLLSNVPQSITNDSQLMRFVNVIQKFQDSNVV